MMYNESSIVRGAVVNFTADETALVADFHKSRIAFALHEGKLLLNEYDEREHRVYLKEDFGIDDELFETLVRGYIKKGRIVFYKSSYYNAIEPRELRDSMDDILSIAVKYFGSDTYEIWNGVDIGEYGTEWSPSKIITAISDRPNNCHFCGKHTLYYDVIQHRWSCRVCTDIEQNSDI